MTSLLIPCLLRAHAEAPDWVVHATAEAALDAQARLASFDLARVGLARQAMVRAPTPGSVREPTGEFTWTMVDRAGETIDVPIDTTQLALGAALAALDNTALGPDTGMRSSTMFLSWVPYQIGGLDLEVASQLASDPVYVDQAAAAAVSFARTVVVPLLPASEIERLRGELNLDLVELRSHWAGMRCPTDARADEGSVLRGFLCRHPETAAIWSAWTLRGAEALGVDVRTLARELDTAWSRDTSPAAVRARTVLKAAGGGG